MVLTVRKIDDRRLRLEGARSLYAWTTYEIRVVAPDFRDWAGPYVATLVMDGEDGAYASCELARDPVRRDVAAGTLVVGDSEHAHMFDDIVESGAGAGETGLGPVGAYASVTDYVDGFVLDVRSVSGASVVLHAPVRVHVCRRPDTSVAPGDGDRSPLSTASMWTPATAVPRVSGTTASLQVRDRSSTSVVLDLRTLAPGTSVDVYPVTRAGYPIGSDPFDAYVSVTTVDAPGCRACGSWASSGAGDGPDVLSGFLVNGFGPLWDYADSSLLPSPVHGFTFHVTRMPGETSFRAVFRVDGAAPAGVEADGAGTVPGSGVNSGD